MTLAGLLLGLGGAGGGQRSAFAPWADTGLPGAEARLLHPAEIYPNGTPKATHRLDATVVFARGTPWSEARALRQIRRTAAVFSACAIRFGRVRLARIRLPRAARRIDAGAPDPGTGVPPNAVRLATALPAGTSYPVAFLLAGVDGSETVAVSYRSVDEQGPSAPYFDTAWIGYRAHWLPRADEDYSPLAHEFAHLLCRCGHRAADRRHLLHKARNFLSSYVLPEHCALFRESSLVAEAP